MKHLLSSSAAAIAMVFSVSSASAQTVSADIRFHDRPVSGRIVVSDPHRDYDRRDNSYRRPAPRVIIVERYHAPRGNAYGYWDHRGFRPVDLWYDGQYDRFYERNYGIEGLRRVRVYERDGRYYRDQDDRYDRDEHGGHGHHNDRD